MQAEFKDAKLKFYMSLRKDKIVESLDAETDIRELTEKIILYKDHLDRANKLYALMDKFQEEYSLKKQDKPKSSSTQPQNDGVIQFDEGEIYLSPFLDFADVEAIAYCIGTYQDNRNVILRLFTKRKPLNEELKKYKSGYKKFKKTGLLESKYIGELLVNEIGSGLERKPELECFSGPSKTTIEVCYDYLSRSANLVKIAKSGNVIKNYYYDEASYNFRAALKGESDPTVTLETKLTNEEINEISGYFIYQSKINGIVAMMLYTHHLQLSGETNLKGKAEEFYREYITGHTLKPIRVI